MVKEIIKRDGRKESFDRKKIIGAISKAMMEVMDGEIDVELAERIASSIEAMDASLGVEDVQDIIERRLMASHRKDVARAYILYREARNKARGRKQADLFTDIIATKSNDVTRDNANMNADTPAGMMMKFAAETSKPFVDDYLLSDEAKEAVSGNYIHIHDKDYYPTKSLTCLQHPLDKLLAEGFRAGHGASRPARRIETAAILAAISMECVQNEMHGGQAVPAFDFMLAPYVRATFVEEVREISAFNSLDLSSYEDIPINDYDVPIHCDDPEVARCLNHARCRTVHRVHQAMESFIHNMNTIHSRGGNQVGNCRLSK